MPKPERFTQIEKLQTCHDCTHYKFSYETKKAMCTKHDFPLPITYSTRELEEFTCDDVSPWPSDEER